MGRAIFLACILFITLDFIKDFETWRKWWQQEQTCRITECPGLFSDLSECFTYTRKVKAKEFPRLTTISEGWVILTYQCPYP